jgi:hypothetical protein
MSIESDVLALPHTLALAVTFANVVASCTREGSNFPLLDQLVDVKAGIASRQAEFKVLEVVLAAELALVAAGRSRVGVDFKNLGDAVGMPDGRPGRRAVRFFDSGADNPAVDQEAVGEVEPVAPVAARDAKVTGLALKVAAGLLVIDFLFRAGDRNGTVETQSRISLSSIILMLARAFQNGAWGCHIPSTKNNRVSIH